ncbi:hypothetical protein BJ742DRAFT_438848 [Cladochytrium replicatum]|nr:hypothetical protein BJ742DRAFT_438848 [Cladochytrium replicatum]
MDRSPTRPHSNAQTPAASARASRASLSWTADFETPRAKSLITPLRVFDRLRESAEVSPAFSPESPATFASPKRKLCSILGDHSMTSTQSSGIRHVPQSWKRKRVRTMDDECVFVGKERAVDTETLQSGTMMSSLPLSDPPVPTRYSDDEESPMLFRNERVVKGKVSISPVLFDLMKEDRKADLKASPSMKRDRSGLGTLPAMSDAGLSAQGQINKTNDRRISIHELRTRRSKAKKRRRVTISGTGMIKNGQIKTSGAKTPVLASRTRNAIGMERSLSTDNASSVMPIPNINGVKTPRLVHLRRTNRKLIRLDDADDNDVPNGSIKSPSKLLSMELPTPNAFPERGEPESAKKSIDNSSCNLSKSNGPPAVVDDPSPSNHTSLQKRTSQSKNPQCFVGSLQTDNDDEYGGDMEYGQSLLDIIHESTQRFGNGSSYHHNEDAEKMIALEEACGSHGCTPALSDGVGEIREHDSDTRLSLDEKKMELRDGGTKTVRIADSVKPKILGNSNVLRDNQMQEFETPSASISFSTGGGKPMTVNQASSDRGRKLIAEVSLTDGLVDEPGESYLDQNIGVLTASAKEEIGIPNIGRVDHLIFPSEGLNTLQNADLVSRAEFANQASSFSTERRQKMDLNPDTLGLVSRFSSEVAADPPTIASGTGEHPSTEIIDSNASFCFQTPKRISNVVDSKTVTISPESHGFTNGRGRKVEPNAAGLGVAAKLMAEISQDCALDSGIEIGDSSNRPQFGFGSTSRAPATVGFSTGSGKSVKVPPGGEERARRLIAEIEGMGEPLNSVASPTPAYATRNTNRLPFKEPPASPFPGLSTFNTQTKVSNLHVSSPPPGWTTGTIGKRQVFRSPLIISKERQVFRSPLIISKERILDQKMKGSGQVYTAAYSDVSQKRLALQRGDIDDENQPPEQWENQFNMSDTERGLSDLPSHGAGGFLRLTNGRGKAMPIPSKKGADFAAALISDSHPRGSELSVDDKGDLGKENRMFEGMNGPLNDFCKSTLSAVPKPFLGRTTGKGGSVRVPSARKLEQASAVFGDIFNALLASPSTRTAVHLGTAERPPKTPLLPGRASSFQNMKRTNSTTSTFSSGGSPSVNAGQTPKLPKRNGRFVLPQRTSSPFQQIAAPSSSTKPKNLEIFNLDGNSITCGCATCFMVIFRFTERLHGRKQLSQLSDRQALTAEQLESIGM